MANNFDFATIESTFWCLFIYLFQIHVMTIQIANMIPTSASLVDVFVELTGQNVPEPILPVTARQEFANVGQGKIDGADRTTYVTLVKFVPWEQIWENALIQIYPNDVW